MLGFILVAVASIFMKRLGRSDWLHEAIDLEDVAKLADVGIATGDRVLNERDNISASTATKVIVVAEERGLRRIMPAIYRSGRVRLCSLAMY
jgi:DNA-binding LacI/PurR family transcriptional regulator